MPELTEEQIVNLAAEAAQIAVERAAARLPIPYTHPATVIGFDPGAGSPTAIVQLDGLDATGTIGAAIVMAEVGLVQVGMRVMVLLTPPSAAIVLGPIGGALDGWNQVGVGGGPAFAAGWSAYSVGPYPPAAFRRVGDSVHLRGLVKSGTGTVFTLPGQYRPSQAMSFATDGDSAWARVDVLATGEVFLAFGTAVAYLSLSGITFPVDPV